MFYFTSGPESAILSKRTLMGHQYIFDMDLIEEVVCISNPNPKGRGILPFGEQTI